MYMGLCLYNDSDKNGMEERGVATPGAHQQSPPQSIKAVSISQFVPVKYSKQMHWLLREFFGRKVTFFLIYISKDPHDSGDHFNIKISVVGARCVGEITLTR